MNKNGLSLLSMVIYVVLFFSFMTFATIIATNTNYTSLSYKGRVINAENFQKLQYNMVNSSKNSTSIDNINQKIIFSNGDEYSYDSEKKIIFKNGGKLIYNVNSFEIVDVSKLNGVSEKLIKDEDGNSTLDDKKDYICVNVNLEKYGSVEEYQLFVVAGDDVNA